MKKLVLLSIVFGIITCILSFKIPLPIPMHFLPGGNQVPPLLSVVLLLGYIFIWGLIYFWAIAGLILGLKKIVKYLTSKSDEEKS